MKIVILFYILFISLSKEEKEDRLIAWLENKFVKCAIARDQSKIMVSLKEDVIFNKILRYPWKYIHKTWYCEAKNSWNISPTSMWYKIPRVCRIFFLFVLIYFCVCFKVSRYSVFDIFADEHLLSQSSMSYFQSCQMLWI